MSKKNPEAPKPMDDSAKERAVGVPLANNYRVCHAAKTLVAEFDSLFPETAVEYSNVDGRNTALDVTFDITSLDDEDAVLVKLMLTMVEDDERVEQVVFDDDPASSILISFRSNARTQDDRSTFNLDEVWMILTGDEQ